MFFRSVSFYGEFNFSVRGIRNFFFFFKAQFKIVDIEQIKRTKIINRREKYISNFVYWFRFCDSIGKKVCKNSIAILQEKKKKKMANFIRDKDQRGYCSSSKKRTRRVAFYGKRDKGRPPLHISLKWSLIKILISSLIMMCNIEMLFEICAVLH